MFCAWLNTLALPKGFLENAKKKQKVVNSTVNIEPVVDRFSINYRDGVCLSASELRRRNTASSATLPDVVLTHSPNHLLTGTQIYLDSDPPPRSRRCSRKPNGDWTHSNNNVRRSCTSRLRCNHAPPTVREAGVTLSNEACRCGIQNNDQHCTAAAVANRCRRTNLSDERIPDDITSVDNRKGDEILSSIEERLSNQRCRICSDSSELSCNNLSSFLQTLLQCHLASSECQRSPTCCCDPLKMARRVGSALGVLGDEFDALFGKESRKLRSLFKLDFLAGAEKRLAVALILLAVHTYSRTKL